jgi:hypothetical protein
MPVESSTKTLSVQRKERGGWRFFRLYFSTAWRVLPPLLLNSALTLPVLALLSVEPGLGSTLVVQGSLLIVAWAYGSHRWTRRIAPLSPPLTPRRGTLLAAVTLITGTAILGLLAPQPQWKDVMTLYLLWILVLTSIGELFLLRASKASRVSKTGA